jgi:thiol-disulfide isomerase/thioredoxin
MVIKLFFKITIVSFAVKVLIALITSSIAMNSLLMFIVFFYFTCFCISTIKSQQSSFRIFTIVFVSNFVIELYGIYLYLVDGNTGLPYVILNLLAIISGFLYFRLKTPLNLIPLLLTSFFAVFMYYQGWNYWIHKAQHGSFTGKIEAYKLQQKVEGIDQHNNKISNKTLENKIVLLDFWHSRCGVCFQKFPQLQAFYNKYRNDDSIVVFAVDKPIEEDKQKSVFKVIEEEGYNFPVLLPTDEELPDKFGVFRFPVTFVINRQGNVVYKGDIEGAILMVEELKLNN